MSEINMPRPHRVDYEGAWHHIMNRGAGGATVFTDDDDRNRFLDELATSASMFSLEVHAYCLMGNHYHLLLRSGASRLSESMQRLASRFTHYANGRRSRDGPMFRGRYNSVLVDSDAHLTRALRYIHLNPVQAGLVVRPEDWQWSSARAYRMATSKPSWLQTDVLLSMFGTAPGATYDSFMSAGVDEQTRNFYRTLGP